MVSEQGYISNMTCTLHTFMIIAILYHSVLDQLVDLRDALAHLVAVVLGSYEKPCHLHQHLLNPQELVNTFIPGSMVSIVIYSW